MKLAPANKRVVLAIGILAVIAAGLVTLWTLHAFSAGGPNHVSFKDAVQSAITNPVSFAKSRFTGGIGALLLADPTTGAPVIHEVIPGSPAQVAGLRDGDVILKVGDVPTTGKPLAQIVSSIRGIPGGSVTLTIQRPGSTNLECILHRISWKTMGVPQ